MKTFYYLIVLLIFALPVIKAQSVSISETGTAPNNSAMLEVKSSTKGFLPPRMNTVQRESIASPEKGLIVFDTDRKALFLFDSLSWKIIVTQDPNSVNSFGNVQNTVPPNIIDGSDFYSDQLGATVAIWKEYAFIGAPGAYLRPGYVLVYHRTGDKWDFAQLISAPVPLNNMQFGISLCAKENYLFIGSSQDKNGANIVCGSVYIYALSGTKWVYQNRLLPSLPVANGRFGNILDANTNADELVAYASGNDIANIYRRTGTNWGVPQSINIANVSSLSMQADGDAIAFGNPLLAQTLNAVNYTQAGGIYFYIKSGSNYTFAALIQNPSPENNDRFGKKVMMADNYGSLDYILIAGSNNQMHIGSIGIANPANNNFSGIYSKTINGNEGLGNWFAKANPYVSNFSFSGTAEYFLAGDNDRIGIYSGSSAAAWFAQKGGNLSLPEPVSYINFGTRYSIGSYAAGAGTFNTSPVYIVVGTPLANDGKGAFYFMKF